MEMSTVFFYLFSAAVLAFGFLTVTTKGLFRSAIYLLFTLTSISALYFLLHFEFIAAVQIIVYVGGIVVLILFSLFLTQQASTSMTRPPLKYIFFSAVVSLAGFSMVWWLLTQHQFPASSAMSTVYQVPQIGKQMLSTGRDGYILPFEAVSILLLAAMIGCIAIAYKPTTPATSNGTTQQLGDVMEVKKEATPEPNS
jgi:NADH-quinone oxidoreductase subunit J